MPSSHLQDSGCALSDSMAEGKHISLVPGLSRFTECSVCMLKIKNHRCLPCMHAFCHDCLVPLVQGHTIACPMCRESCTLKPGGVTELPKSPLLMEVLGRVCEECLERSKEIHCDHCDQELCAPCHELCKLSIELEEMTKTRDKKIEEIRRVKGERIARKEEHIAQLNENVQKAFDAILTKQHQIAEEFEEELSKQVVPLDNWCDDILEQCKEIQSFIDKGDKERLKTTVARVKSIREDCRRSVTTATLQRPMPPDEANYGAHLETILNRLSLTKHEVGNEVTPAKPTKHEVIVTTKGSGNGQFESPTHIAISPVTKSLVVTDKGNSRIQIFNSQRQYQSQFGSKGKFAGQFDFGTYGNSGGVAVTGKGGIVVADSVNHRIQMFNENGAHPRCFGSYGDSPGKYSAPTGLSVYRNKIFVCDSNNYRVQVLTEDGKVIRIFGSQDTMGGYTPEAIAVCDNGEVVLAVIKNLNRIGKIMVFTATGQYKTSLCTEQSGPLKLLCPTGLTLSSTGNIVVSDYDTHQVHILTPTGQLLHSFGSLGDKPGQFNHPVGVVCLDDDRIVVVDYDNHRVQVLSFDL